MMTVEEIGKNFNTTIDVWKKTTGDYTEHLFALKPAEDAWSIGQVCQHLITSTKRIFIVIDKCLAGNVNEHEQKTEAGDKAFTTNILSEVKVKLPIAVQATPPQPESAAFARNEFEEIHKTFLLVSEKVNNSNSSGKEKHPVLGFLSAKEWLQSIEMHFRHHLKQKESIDAFLKDA
ncbi:MAG TPA: DinB family protein [Bacteroidia bacterium]|nr:DinB family protein [Bacteroidia bacterium]